MNLGPVFVSVIVISSLIINITIAAFVSSHGAAIFSSTGAAGFKAYLIWGKIPSFYPPWLFELHLAFFWYCALYGSLKRVFCDVTKSSYLWEMAPIIFKLLFPYIAISLFVRFVLDQHILIAYVLSWFLFVYIPMNIAIYRYPKKQAKFEAEYLNPKKIEEIAKQHSMAQQFLSYYPEAQVDIVDNRRKNNVCICVFSDRIPRNEREGMLEDLVLEIPVDLKHHAPVKGRGSISRYIFHTNENASAVVELNDTILPTPEQRSEPLDDFTLSRYDSAFDRYPSLVEIPLPVAVRR